MNDATLGERPASPTQAALTVIPPVARTIHGVPPQTA